MDAEEHSHVYPTWELYPRVYYFRSRYIDFKKRFGRVIKALPERFHEKAPLSFLDSLNDTLNSNLHLMVLGQDDLPTSQLTVYPEALNRYSQIPFTSGDETHACICYVKAQNLDEKVLKGIESVLSYISSTLLERVSCICSIFIVCDTPTCSHGEEPFQKNILDLAQKTISSTNIPFEILMGQTVKDLPSIISNSFEKQIMNGFLEIFSFLQKFVRNDQSGMENVDILSSDNVVHAIQDFLRNGHHLIDSKAVTEDVSILEMIIELLCKRIMCSAVTPMASKHNIPEWACHELLLEISFEKQLQKSLSENTRQHLQKVGANALELAKLIAEGKYDEKSNTNKVFNFDFILYLLQKDLVECVTSAEKKMAAMKQLTIVIRKMMFEIKGYLKQTIVEIDIVEIGFRDLETKDIPDSLTKDLTSTEGVYGMGIIYGQLEIHLCTGLEEKTIVDAKESVKTILKRHRFPYPYTIKTVEEIPQKFAKDFYESSEKLLSPFPDDESEIREGTLACFIKDSDNAIYAVTCAHVVDPHGRLVHEVHIRSQNTLFGHSSSDLTVSPNKSNMHFADFAAVKVLRENQEKLGFHFKDEFGNNKKGRIENVHPSELVGMSVFKYGASTGLTQGIVASDSYIFSSNESRNYIMIVEPLPLVSDSLSVSSNGDSKTPTQEDTHFDFNASTQPLTVEDELLPCSGPSSPHSIEYLTVQHRTNTIDTHGSGICDGQESKFKGNQVRSTEECTGSGCLVSTRPEQQEGHSIRDSELGVTRNSNEVLVLSQPFSDVSGHDEEHLVATKGDSGAVICRNNLQTNEIELIAMITAGDFKLHEPLNSGSERKKCLSVCLKTILDELSELSGKQFFLC